MCRDDHICAGLKAGIYGVVHGAQFIWEDNLIEEKCFFNLLMRIMCLTRSIE